jgi:hypothetical protein
VETGQPRVANRVEILWQIIRDSSIVPGSVATIPGSIENIDNATHSLEVSQAAATYKKSQQEPRWLWNV